MTQTRKATRSKLGIAALLFLALIMAACASEGGREKKKAEIFKASVEAFNGAFRWEDYAAAAGFVPPGKIERFWAAVDIFKGKIHIVDYQIRGLDHVEGSCSGTATLYFQYWRTDSPNLRAVSFPQKWYYLEKEKHWKVQDSGFGAMTRAAP